MSPVGLGTKIDLLAKTTSNLPTDGFQYVNFSSVMGPDRDCAGEGQPQFNASLYQQFHNYL
jgi:hypothetical protein